MSDYDDDDDEDVYPTFHDPFENAAHLSTEDEGRGLSCELRNYESRINSRGDRTLLHVGKQSKLRLEKDRDYDAALIQVKTYNREMDLIESRLQIQSPHLKAALRKVVKTYPDINMNVSTIVISGKPRCFFHYRRELVAYGSTLQDPVAVQHLAFAMEFMYQALQTETTSWYIWAEPESPDVLPGLEWQHLWMAFRPQKLLYVHCNDVEKVVRMEKMSIDHRETAWHVQITEIVYDGKCFGRRTRSHEIDRYESYKPFVELPLYPLEYHKEQQRIFSHAVARGRRIVRFNDVHYCQYNGNAELMSPFRDQTFHGEVDYRPLRTALVTGRIMVDSKTFASERPNQCFELSSVHKETKTLDDVWATFLDEDFAVCHNLLPGFSLKDKRWGFFNIEAISDIEFSQDAYEKLILPEGQKEMIYSLVKSHGSDRSGFDDIIRGKGKGMIFLLHGAAGVGKTITAESIAERSQQPLYVIGSGDLGVDINTVEAKLNRVLRLAMTWNAILLLDEADVFLEQRSSRDLKRNGLVSVFLRVLEYYEGVMFLTTNRVKKFDYAFRSRIHMAIHYQKLDEASRSELWTTFIERAVEGPRPSWFNANALEELSRERLNGRQIKNVVRMAHALAVAANVELMPEHLGTSLENMRVFEQIMGVDEDSASDEIDDYDEVEEASNPRKRSRRDG